LRSKEAVRVEKGPFFQELRSSSAEQPLFPGGEPLSPLENHFSSPKSYVPARKMDFFPKNVRSQSEKWLLWGEKGFFNPKTELGVGDQPNAPVDLNALPML